MGDQTHPENGTGPEHEDTHAENPTPETEFVVTLKMKLTKNGTHLYVEHDPTLYADIVIDMCSRAQRVYERHALIQAMALAQAQAMKQMQDTRRIMPGGGGGRRIVG